jgi:hypothetical protein
MLADVAEDEGGADVFGYFRVQKSEDEQYYFIWKFEGPTERGSNCRLNAFGRRKSENNVLWAYMCLLAQ